jgi:hypothetical protein
MFSTLTEQSQNLVQHISGVLRSNFEDGCSLQKLLYLKYGRRLLDIKEFSISHIIESNQGGSVIYMHAAVAPGAIV